MLDVGHTAAGIFFPLSIPCYAMAYLTEQHAEYVVWESVGKEGVATQQPEMRPLLDSVSPISPTPHHAWVGG